MKTHRKPDLLFILTVFVGFGIVVSSYIQYSRANPSAGSVPASAVKQPVNIESGPATPLVLVSNPADTELRFHDDNGVVVNKSSNQP